jgi:hypothetical protein
MRFAGAVCLFVLLAPLAGARAQTKEQCAQAYEQAQSLQMEHRLLEARAELQICTHERCPKQVSADCWRWLANVEAATPTLVITARSAAGEDLVDVTLSLDGRVLESALIGKAMQVDPGAHTLHAEAAGFVSSEERIVVREGEKARIINLVLAPVPVAVPVTSSEQPAEVELEAPIPDEPDPRPGRLRTAGYVLLGAGVAAAGAGTYLAYDGYHDGKVMRDACKPRCSESEVDSAKLKLTMGHVGLGLGVAALATGIVTLLVGRAQDDDDPAGEEPLALDVAIEPRRAFAGLRGSF